MTNIKCTYKCVFQNNGICNLESVSAKKINSDNDCIYYEEKLEK